MAVHPNKERIQIQFGKFNLKLLEIRTNKSSRDTYANFFVPDVYLHYSFHHPKPPIHPNAHFHLKSEPLNIHEDIADFSPEEWATLATDLGEAFTNNISEPSADEPVVMLPLSANSFGLRNIVIVFQCLCSKGSRYS